MPPPAPDERFRELTPQLLRQLSADDIGGAVSQHVRLLSGGAPVVEPDIVGGLPPGTRAIYLGTLVDAAVNAGGFTRFFVGESGRFAGGALSGYELLGAEEYASIMRAAIATYESERLRLAGLRHPARGTSARMFTGLDDVDQRYYALGDRIYNIWAAAVRLRPELFGD